MQTPFTVLAECSDLRTGKRFLRGDTFDPAPTVDQATRLVAAGCLPKSAVDAAQVVEDNGGIDAAALIRNQINHDGLFDKSTDELRDVIEAEGVTPSEDHMRAAIVASIRAHRARPAAALPAATEMRTDEGEADARAADEAAGGAAADEAAVEVATDENSAASTQRSTRRR
jgi:hypothetical protein